MLSPGNSETNGITVETLPCKTINGEGMKAKKLKSEPTFFLIDQLVTKPAYFSYNWIFTVPLHRDQSFQLELLQLLLIRTVARLLMLSL